MPETDTLSTGAQDALGTAMGEAITAFDRYGGRLQAGRATIKQAQEDTDARIAQLQAEEEKAKLPVRERLQDLMKDDQPLKLKDAGQFNPGMIKPEEMQKNFQTWMVLAMLGGALTRQPATTAMNAMAGAMQGWMQGDRARFDKDFKTFQAASRNAIAMNQKMIEEYRAVRQKNAGNLRALLEEEKLIALKYSDMVKLAALKEGRIEKVVDLDEKREKGNLDARLTVLRIEAMRNTAQIAHEDRMASRETASADRRYVANLMHEDRVARLTAQAGPSGTDDPALVKMLADKWRQGDSSALAGLGNSRAATNLRREILSQAARDATEAGQSGAELAGQRANYQADSSSLRQYQNYVNRVEALGKKIDKDIDLLFDIAGKGVGPTKIPAFDKWVQMGRKATGDPNIAAFETQIQTIKNEYGRSMSGPASNAQLHTSAMKHADELINSAQNLEQLKASVKMMRRDIKNQTDVAEEQISAIKGRLSGRRAGDSPRSFATEADAAAAGLAPGTKIIINGVSGTWQ